MPDLGLDPYDAILLVSFGGPEGPDDVLPFLENVTRGRGIPRERLLEVGHHYELFGGRSPINDQCRDLLDALRGELDARGFATPLFWGNRNWAPYLADAMKELAAAGHRRVAAVMTSAYPSYSSCRQYREDLFAAALDQPVQIDRIRHYATHPGFVAASVDATVDALGQLGDVDGGVHLLFVTHSIPDAMAHTAGPPPQSAEGAYVDWHRSVADAVAAEVAARTGVSAGHELVYCSRSGPPQQPWLEPDVNDRLTELAADGVAGVVAIPIGFVSDHMEVVYDLDTEASATAKDLGLAWARAATAGVHPGFVGALVDLLVERAAEARGEAPDRPVVDGGPVGWTSCAVGCCTNLRDPDRPTLCGALSAS